MTPARETLALDGHEVTVHQGGAGAPVVLLHDVFGPVWSGLAERLARTRTVVLPSLVGFPGSAYREDLDTMEDLAFWTLALLEARGLGGVDVVGEGYGGWVAAEVASRWPATFRRMALLAPFGLRLAAAPPGGLFELRPAQYRAALFRDGESELARRMAPDLPPSPEAFEEKLVCDRAAARFAWRPYLHNPRLAARLARSRAPALVVWGADDHMEPPAYAEAWRAALPDARVEIVAGAGHALAYEQPEVVAKLVDAFFTR
jgi:pimeloyl-ACP methyl ester carboxylesterase